MSKGTNWKSMILIVIAFFVVGFVGIVAGNLFMSWRRAGAEVDYSKNYRAPSNGLLNENDPFPDVPLIGPDGNQVNSRDIFGGQKTAILFFAPGCDPCSGAMHQWATYQDKLPDGFRVIGLASANFESVRGYIDEIGFPFPYYCDTGRIFVAKYGINSFPGVMGLFSDGRIAFLSRSLFGKFNPVDAFELIDKSKNNRTRKP